jgi:antitoxin HicB
MAEYASLFRPTRFEYRPVCGTVRRRERNATRTIAVNQSRTFAVVLEPEDDGGFTVRVPAFPKIVSYGKDEREALAMAKDAIGLLIADSVARGEPLGIHEVTS